MEKIYKKSSFLLLAVIFLFNITSSAQDYLLNDFKLLVAGKSCLYAVKEKEGLFQVTNQGIKFKLINATKEIKHLAVSGSSIFICSKDDGFSLSTNQGVEWKKVNSPDPELNIITSSGTIAIYGNEIFISSDVTKQTYISIDEGITWNKIKSFPESIKFSGSIDSKIFVSTTKDFYFSDGDRNNWQKCQESLDTNNTTPNRLYSVKKEGTLYVSDDKGLTWQSIKGYTGIEDLKRDYDDDLDRYHSFTQISSLFSLNQILFANIKGTVFTSNNQGHIWSYSNLGLPNDRVVTQLAVFGTDLYAIVGSQDFYISHDMGASWVFARAFSNSELFNIKSKYKNCVLDFDIRKLNDSELLSHLLFKKQYFKNFPIEFKYIGPYASNGSTIIAGCKEVGFGLFMTVDGGAHWKKVNKGFKRAGYQTPDATFIFGSGNRIFVGTSMMGLFYSDDYGESWKGNTDELPIGGQAGYNNFLQMESMFKTDTVLHLEMETIEGDFISLDNGKSWKHSSGKSMSDITAEIRENVARHKSAMHEQHAILWQKERERAYELRKIKFESHQRNYYNIPKANSYSGPDYRALSQDRFMEKNNHRDSWISSQGAIHMSR